MFLSEKTLDIIVAAALLLLITVGLGLLMAWGTGIVLSDSENEQQKLQQNENGNWVLPADQQPDGFQDLQQAPSLALLPGRLQAPPPPKESAERPSLARATQGFLSNWESFDPQVILAAEQRSNRQPYQEKLLPWVDKQQIDDLVQRQEADDWPQVCPTCRLGQSWVSAGQIQQHLRINNISDNLAHVSISGVIAIDDPDNPGILLNRNYGLLLKKINGRWLVERAVADRGRQL